jgi:hypothetical protein
MNIARFGHYAPAIRFGNGNTTGSDANIITHPIPTSNSAALAATEPKDTIALIASETKNKEKDNGFFDNNFLSDLVARINQ